MRISDEVREYAAMILSASASGQHRPRRHLWRSMAEIGESIGAPPGAVDLALAAHADLYRRDPMNADYYAEPEAMLRTGWSP